MHYIQRPNLFGRLSALCVTTIPFLEKRLSPFRKSFCTAYRNHTVLGKPSMVFSPCPHHHPLHHSHTSLSHFSHTSIYLLLTYPPMDRKENYNSPSSTPDPQPPLLDLTADELLRQLARDMVQKPGIPRVQVPIIVSWGQAVEAAANVLRTVQRQFIITDPRTPEQRRSLRALLDTTNRDRSPGVPATRNVFSNLSLENTPMPKRPSSAEDRERIQRIAEETKRFIRRDPYLLMYADPGEGFLPALKARMMLSGIDGDDRSPTVQLKTSVLLDTGAHVSSISEDLLSPEFRSYLRSTENQPYVVAEGSIVQVSCVIVFSNSYVKLESVARVVKRSRMPNQLSGVLLGQKGFIDNIQYRSIPRNLVLARGEQMSEEFWGLIDVEQYLTSTGTIMNC